MRCLAYLSLIGIALGGVVKPSPSTNPDFPGQCWLEHLKVAMKPGETYSQIGDCTEYHCHDDFTYAGYGCGFVPRNNNGVCKIGAFNDSLKFPDCCPEVDC